MAIQTLTDVGINNKVRREYDGAVYSLLGDAVIKDIGDMFSETHSELAMTINSGEAVMGGNFFKITGSERVTVLPDTSGVVCLSIDVTRENGSRGFVTFKTEQDVRRENINDAGIVRDLPLYRVSSGAAEITLVEDIRPIKASASGLEYSEVGTFSNDKIIQIWEDTSRSVALYPSGVAEAIKWDTTKTLTEKINEIGGSGAIDITRNLQSVTFARTPYTNNNEDVIILGWLMGSSIRINNSPIMDGFSNNTSIMSIYLKKGYTFSTTNTSDTYKYVVWGVLK